MCSAVWSAVSPHSNFQQDPRARLSELANKHKAVAGGAGEHTGVVQGELWRRLAAATERGDKHLTRMSVTDAE